MVGASKQSSGGLGPVPVILSQPGCGSTQGPVGEVLLRTEVLGIAQGLPPDDSQGTVAPQGRPALANMCPLPCAISLAP